MGVADDRRIIMGTYVSPKEGSLMEDDSTRKWVMDNSINTTMGGKAVNTDIADAQTDDNWYKESVSFTGPYQLRDSDNADVFKFLYIKNLNASGGTTIEVSLAAEGEWDDADANSGNIEWDDASFTPPAIRNGGYWNPDYFLRIRPGSSIMLRGDGNIKCDAIHVHSSTESSIEFVIAK